MGRVSPGPVDGAGHTLPRPGARAFGAGGTQARKMGGTGPVCHAGRRAVGRVALPRRYRFALVILGDDRRVDWLERSGGLACYRRGGATRVLGMADDEAGRVLEPLSEAECMGLLADGGLGRLVYNSRYGPMALPVVYRIDGESIVLGTWDPALFDEDLRTGIANAEYQVAVEADQIDLEAREGWIVLVRERRIIWIPKPSARRSSAPGLSRGSAGRLRTSSG